MKNLFLSIGLTLVSIVASLLVAEGALRLKNADMKNYDIEMWRYAKELKKQSGNPLLGHEHIPSSSAELQSVQIRTNAYGLRGGELPAPEARPERVVLFLGSSITLGWGVPEEKTMTALLQEKFQQNEQDVLVLNAGIGNYNATRYIENFLTNLAELKPTDIVVHYFINDAEKLTAGGGNWFLRNSQLAVTLWMAMNRLIYQGGEKSLLEHYKNVYQPQAEGRQEMEREMQKLADYTRQHDIRVYFAIVPDIHNLTDYPYRFIHSYAADLARRHGFTFVDLYDAMNVGDAKKLWAMPGDPHPNALGHRLMADELYPYLSGQK